MSDLDQKGNCADRPPGYLYGVASKEHGRVDLPTDLLAGELLLRLRETCGGGVSAALAAHADLLGVLGIKIESCVDIWENRFSRFRMGATFDHLSRFLRKPLTGMTCVEIGAGSMNPLGPLFVSLMLGASRAIAVDLDPPQDLSLVVRALARCAAYGLLDPRLLCHDTALSSVDVAANLKGFDLAKLYQGDVAGLDSKRLQLRRESAMELSVGDGEADFLMSTSFLEHVPSVSAALAEIRRVMRPGGITSHSIDGFDHRYYGDNAIHPLDFLRVETDDLIVYECNRMRPLQFVAEFSKAGFEVLHVDIHDRVAVDAEFSSRLAVKYRDLPLEQLAVTRATVHAKAI